MAKVDTKFALALPKSSSLSFTGGKPQVPQAKGVEKAAGVPYINFFSGQQKSETRQQLQKALPTGTLLDEGQFFLCTRDEVVLLPQANTLMWAIEVYSTWAVQTSDGEVIKASAESFDAVPVPPKNEPKKPGIVGRCVVAVLADLGNGKLVATLATLRTSAGRLDGLKQLLKARELGNDAEWLKANDKVRAYVPDEAAVFRAALQAQAPVVKAGGNTWTGFKGPIVPFPPKREYIDALGPAVNDAEMQRRCAEWWKQEVAELIAKGGQPLEAGQPAAGE